MAVLDRIATARSDQFAARVAMILMKLCIDVLNESETEPNHGNRVRLAQQHIRAELNTKAVAAAVIASNATIQTTIDNAPDQLGENVPDGDLEYVLSGLYNQLANAYTFVS